MKQPSPTPQDQTITLYVQTGVLRLIPVSMIHVAVSLGTIGISTFIPAQLAIIGWEPTIIALLIGIATLFEVFRLLIGFLGDRYPLFGSYHRNYIIVGLVAQTSGLVFVSQTLGSLAILFGMILFTVGSATVATMTDAYLIDISTSVERGKVAANIQFFRLLGFAAGGILGAVLYGRLRFEGFFVLLAGISLLFGIISVLAIRERSSEIVENTKKQLNIGRSIQLIKEQLSKREVVAMSFFLVLFLIGLFAQDAVLEPYAVSTFNFTEDNIGGLAAVWGVTTLIFIPLAFFIEKKIGRLLLSAIGTVIGGLGLLMIAFLGTSSVNSILGLPQIQQLFLLSVAIFGVGLGLLTTPSTAMMLDVCAKHPKTRTLLLALFGLITTVGRSSASFFSALVMLGNSFQLLFILEAIILACSFFPLIWVHRYLSSKAIEGKRLKMAA
ncbi:MAG: MFS transporter [Candidatus Heimdallarchaeota archaeon]